MKRLGEREERLHASVPTLIYETTLETRRAVIYATLIVILAVTPVFFMGGVSGAFFAPLAFSYVLAVVASMVVALTVTPALSLLLLGNTSRRFAEPRIASRLGGRYEALLRNAIYAPRKVVVVAVCSRYWPPLPWRRSLGNRCYLHSRKGELLVN